MGWFRRRALPFIIASGFLRDGCFFLKLFSIHKGHRDLLRLTWFQRHPPGFQKVRTFQLIATFDDLPPMVQGDWVRLTTVDEPHVFMVLAGDNIFGREWTWRVAHGVPRLVSQNLFAVRLRAVDDSIWHSIIVRHSRSAFAKPGQNRIFFFLGLRRQKEPDGQ